MKKIKNILIVTILLFATSCGFANNVYLMGYGFTEMLPNKYKVSKEIEDGFPGNGLAIVDLDFRANNKQDGISTVWRRINNDGTYSKRLALTHVDIFKRGRVRVAIKPGIYFLDGFRHSDGRRYFKSGAFTKMYSNKQMGWDEDKKEPLYFSFIAETGKELKIPDIFLFANCRSGRSSCSKWDIEFSIFIEKDSRSDDSKYKTGLDIKRLDEYPLEK